MGNETSYLLGCADVSVRNSKQAYITREEFSAGLRRNNSFTFFSRQQGQTREFAAALDRCHETFLEGAPDDDGQLGHDQFIQIFGLSADEYTQRLVRIFDLDNGGTVGFREFVYGLSKFSVDTFERRVQFAYRLFDLDGDGSLDKHELLKAVRSALDTDRRQYDLRPEKQTVKLPMRARVKPYNPIPMGNPAELVEEVDRMARNMGTKRMGIDEFQLLVSRFPQIFQPPEVLYRLMHMHSADAAVVVSALGAKESKKLMESLGRWQHGEALGTGFTDRSDIGPRYRVGAALEPKEVARERGERNDRDRSERDRSERDLASLAQSPRRKPPPPPPPPPPSDESWACHQCTLINPRVARACAACGARRVVADAPEAKSGSRVVGGGESRPPPSAPGHQTPRGARPPVAASASAATLRRSESNASRTSSASGGRPSSGRGSPVNPSRADGGRGASGSSAPSEGLTAFMRRLGLAAHVAALARAEVLTVSDVALMTDEDLKEVGLPKGPRLRILDAVRGGEAGAAAAGNHRGAARGDNGCKICMERPVQVVLKPCGHALMCTQCSATVQQCPACRKRIEETIRYFPM